MIRGTLSICWMLSVLPAGWMLAVLPAGWMLKVLPAGGGWLVGGYNLPCQTVHRQLQRHLEAGRRDSYNGSYYPRYAVLFSISRENIVVSWSSSRIFCVVTENTVSAVRLVECSQEIQLDFYRNTVSPITSFYTVSDTTLRSIDTIIGTD